MFLVKLIIEFNIQFWVLQYFEILTSAEEIQMISVTDGANILVIGLDQFLCLIKKKNAFKVRRVKSVRSRTSCSQQ